MEILPTAPQLQHQPYAYTSPAAAAVTKPTTGTTTPLMDVVAALEHATLAAKHISPSSAVDPSGTISALASIRNAHQVIGSFLAQFEPRPSPFVAGDVAGVDDGDEPMSDRTSGDEAEESSKIVDKVEEGMRECALQSKRRRKRLVPLSWPAGRTDDREISSVDSVDLKRSAMDLVFQFHG